MSKSHKIAILGTGFISDFYTSTLHSQRSFDRVHTVYSRSMDKGNKFKEKWKIANCTDNMISAIQDDDIDTVIIGLPNHLHGRVTYQSDGKNKGQVFARGLGVL